MKPMIGERKRAHKNANTLEWPLPTAYLDTIKQKKIQRMKPNISMRRTLPTPRAIGDSFQRETLPTIAAARLAATATPE